MTSTRRLATVPSPEVARITRPFPCRGLLHHARANRVKMDVPCDRPEIGLVFDQFSPVTALEDMSVEAVSSRPSVGVSRKKALHSTCEVRLRRLQNHVEVVRHNHKRIHPPRTLDGRSSQILNQPIAVCVVADDILPPVTTGHEMVDRTGILNTQSSCHALIGTVLPSDCKEIKLQLGLTPSIAASFAGPATHARGELPQKSGRAVSPPREQECCSY